MKNCAENPRLLSNGKFSTLDWPTHEMIAGAHRARGKALRQMTSTLYHRLWSTLARIARVQTASADGVGDRWCDTTERKLNDELIVGHRGSFMT